MPKEKRFIEDFNEEFNEQALDKDSLNSDNNFENSKKLEDDFELEEGEIEDEEVQNIFEDDFGSFSPGFRSRTSSVSASLESEPIQNLERGLQDVQTNNETSQKTEAQETPMMYNAPQYSSAGYDSVGYESVRNNERVDVTGGASTANLSREINMKRWQESALGYPMGAGGVEGQGDRYIRAPEKQREARGLPFERGNQRRNVGWKEEY